MADFQYSENKSAGSSGGSSSQSSSGGTLDWYNNYVNELLGRGRLAALTPYQQYSGSQLAGFTPDQQAAFSNLRGQVGDWQPLLGQAASATQGALGTLQGLQNGPNVNAASNLYNQIPGMGQFDPNQIQQYLNPYTKNVVDEIGRLGQESFQQNLGDINRAFTGSGQFGSGRNQMMAAEAAKKAQREISAAQGNALAQGYNQATNQYADWANRGINAANTGAQGNLNVLGALGQLGTTTGQLGGQLGNIAGQQQQLGFGDVNAQLGIGQTQQQQAQKGLDINYQNFQQQQQYPWTQLGNWANLFGVPTPNAQSSSSSQSSYSRNNSSGFSTAFKRGGLARLKRYAGGGLFDDEDPADADFTTMSLPAASPLSALNSEREEMLKNILQRRYDLARRTGKALAPVEEPRFLDQLGRAMFSAAAEGPANYGQLIGRTGKAFFDEGDRIKKINAERELARLQLEDKALPETLSGGRNSLTGGTQHFTRVQTKDGSVWMVSNLDPNVRFKISTGGFNKDALAAARADADKQLEDVEFPDAGSKQKAYDDLMNALYPKYLKQMGVPGMSGDQTKPVDPTEHHQQAAKEISGYQFPTPEARQQAFEARTKQLMGQKKVTPSDLPVLDREGMTTGEDTAEDPHQNIRMIDEELKRLPASAVEQRKILEEERAKEERRLTEGLPDPGVVPRMKFEEPPTGIILSPAEKAEQGKVGAGYGEQFTKIQDAAQAAQNTLNTYQRLEGLLEGVKTGRLTPIGTEMAAWIKALPGYDTASQYFGFNVDENTGNKEAARSLGNFLALQNRNPQGGAGMPGALSHYDLQFLEKMVPSLALTPEGNRLIVETAKKLAQRSLEVAKLAREYRQFNPRKAFDAGFNEYIAKWSEAHPLFKDLKYPDQTGGAARGKGESSLDDLLKKYGG